MRRLVPAWTVEPTDRLVEAGGKWFPNRPTVMAVDRIGAMTYIYWPGTDPENPRSLGLLNHEFITVERPYQPRSTLPDPSIRALPAGAWKAMVVCAGAAVLAVVVVVLATDPLYDWMWRAW